jgi:MFS family permease
MAFEVPSGAWADATSRRRLLVVGPLLTAIAFGLWTAYPSYPVFAGGFVLWGLKSALTSGALEALVYDELEQLGATQRYPTLMGRGQSAGVLAAMCSGLVAAPVYAAGGFGAVGAGSVAVCLLASLAAMWLPEIRIGYQVAGTGWAALKTGVGEASRSRTITAAVILVAVVASVWDALDEYTPLLISETDVEAVDVSLLMVVIWAGAGRAACTPSGPPISVRGRWRSSSSPPPR